MRRTRATYVCSTLRASSGGASSQIRSNNVCAATGRPASTASAANSVRNFGGPRSTTPPADTTSNAPSSRKSTIGCPSDHNRSVPFKDVDGGLDLDPWAGRSVGVGRANGVRHGGCAGHMDDVGAISQVWQEHPPQPVVQETGDRLLSIGEFARRSRLSMKALRLYDRLGLLAPDHVDPATGYRRYREHQLGTARL